MMQSVSKDPSVIFPVNYDGYASLDDVHCFISNSGISNVELSIEDISNILDTLIYAGRIERISGSTTEDGDIDYLYKILRPFSLENPLSRLPCFSCPV